MEFGSGFCELVILVIFCAGGVKSDYDFTKMYSLPDLGGKASSTGLKIISHAAKLGSKMFFLALNSQVKNFAVFMRSKASSLPSMRTTEFQFDDESTLNMDEGLIYLSKDFDVKTGMSQHSMNLQWSWSPVKIFYPNVTFVDPAKHVYKGTILADVRKIVIRANLDFSPTHCPVKLTSNTVDSIENVRLSAHWSKPFESEQLKWFLAELPNKWEESVPEALLENLRASAFIRGISGCVEQIGNDTNESSIYDQLNGILYDPTYAYRLISVLTDKYFGRYMTQKK